MRNSITNASSVEVFMQESLEKQNNDTSNSFKDSATKITELENELKKQKAAEKGAKLMQIIWGDKFQSDSLH